MTRPILPAVLLATTLLAGCASDRPPDFAYDDAVPPPAVTACGDNPTTGRARSMSRPPGPPSRRRPRPPPHPSPRSAMPMPPPESNRGRRGISNAIQIYPWSEGALYQVYAAPGQITTIALEPGERLAGSGPIAAGDTARWIIGDTESGAGRRHPRPPSS